MTKQITGTSGTTYTIEDRRGETLPTHYEVELAVINFDKIHGLTSLQSYAYWDTVRQWAKEHPDFREWKANARGYLLRPATIRRRRGSRGAVTAKTMKALVRKGLLEETYVRDADGRLAKFWSLPADVSGDPMMRAMHQFMVSCGDVRDNDHYWRSCVSGQETAGDGGGNRGNLYG